MYSINKGLTYTIICWILLALSLLLRLGIVLQVALALITGMVTTTFGLNLFSYWRRGKG